MDSSTSDEDLMAEFYQCHEEVRAKEILEVVYRRYAPLLLPFLSGARLDDQEVEALIQQVFVRVLETKHPPPGRNPQPYNRDGGASFKTWLVRIAFNLLKDRLRRSGRDITLSSLDGRDDQGQTVPLVATLAGRERSPLDNLLVEELRLQVHACVENLPDPERIAMGLWLMLDAKPALEELASVCDCSVPTACRVLKRALLGMRQCLESKGVDP